MRKLTDLTEIADALTDLIDTARRMRTYYGMFPPATAKERRQFERRNTCELFSFEHDGHLYEAAFETLCGKSDIFTKAYYRCDGQKVTLRQMTACLKAIQTELERGD